MWKLAFTHGNESKCKSKHYMNSVSGAMENFKLNNNPQKHMEQWEKLQWYSILHT